MADTFTLQIIRPDAVFYTGEASMVEMNTTEGEIGVYAGHIPTTTMIAPGVLRIKEADGTEKTAALLSGFVQIMPDLVRIMAEVCEWPEEIDEKRAGAAKERAEKRLSSAGSDVDIMRAEAALKRALVREEVLSFK